MSSHLFFMGALEAERAVADGVRGTGPGPVVTRRDSRPLGHSLVAWVRVSLGTGLIRAGEMVRGAGRAAPLADGVGGRP